MSLNTKLSSFGTTSYFLIDTIHTHTHHTPQTHTHTHTHHTHAHKCAEAENIHTFYGCVCCHQIINPLVPEGHYCERKDKLFPLQIQQLKVSLQLNCGFLIFAPWELMG